MSTSSRKSNGGGICVICEERELRPNSVLLDCSVCRGSMGFWHKRGAAALLERRRKLHIYDTRMQHVQEREPFRAKGKKK